MGERNTSRRYALLWARRYGLVVIAYLLLGLSGVLAFFSASSSLLQQGGLVIVVAWGVFCLTGSILGLFGISTGRTLFELLGCGLGASASLTWTVSLVLQAVARGNALPLTAACMAGMLTVLLIQRWVDASHSQN